jgi:hypothetical protein
LTREYAALLAQVIPVVALALVLELRTFAKRFMRLAKSGALGGRGPLPAIPVAVMFFTCIIAPLLAPAESVALHVVRAQQSEDIFDIALGCLVFIPIFVPVVDVMSAIARGLSERFKEPTSKIAIGSVIFIVDIPLSAVVVRGLLS